MRPGRVKKYMMWLELLVIALVVPMLALLIFGSYIAEDDPCCSASYFGVALSSIALAYTAFAGSFMPGSCAKMPRWIVAMTIYGMVGYIFGLDFAFDTSPDRASIRFVVSSSIAGMLLALNIGMIFLVQIWVTTKKLDLPLSNVWPANTLFALWISLAFLDPANTVFIVVSAFIVLVSVPATMLVEIILDRRAESMRKRLGKIYS